MSIGGINNINNSIINSINSINNSISSSSGLSCSDDDDDTLQQRMEHVYVELMDHRGLLSTSLKQVCDELEAIFKSPDLWKRASRKLQNHFIDSAGAAIGAAAMDGPRLDGIRAGLVPAIAKNNVMQSKRKATLLTSFRNIAVMTARRRRKERQEPLRRPSVHVPVEVMAVIFGLLTSPIDLVSCRAVCKEWLRIINSYDGVLWPRLTQTTFGSDRTTGFNPATVTGMGSHCPAMEHFKGLAKESRHDMLAPYKYKRFIIATEDGYFLRQMNEQTWNRLVHTPARKGLAERRHFVSSEQLVHYLCRPEGSTLKKLAAL
jgi:hypothetical protein